MALTIYSERGKELWQKFISELPEKDQFCVKSYFGEVQASGIAEYLKEFGVGKPIQNAMAIWFIESGTRISMKLFKEGKEK